jgi:Ankyrin repeats (3 copies)
MRRVRVRVILFGALIGLCGLAFATAGVLLARQVLLDRVFQAASDGDVATLRFYSPLGLDLAYTKCEHHFGCREFSVLGAAGGHPAAVQYLLDRGVRQGVRGVFVRSLDSNDPQAQLVAERVWKLVRGEGQALLHEASYRHREAAVHFLLQHGVDPNAELSGDCPLTSALASYRVDSANVEAILRRLIEFGAPINGVCAGYATPLHAFLQQRSSDEPGAVAALIALGADPNAPDMQHGTALHWAVSRSMVEVVTLLLEHGADPDTRGSGGATARQMAKEQLEAERRKPDGQRYGQPQIERVAALLEAAPHRPTR